MLDIISDQTQDVQVEIEQTESKNTKHKNQYCYRACLLFEEIIQKNNLILVSYE